MKLLGPNEPGQLAPTNGIKREPQGIIAAMRRGERQRLEEAHSAGRGEGKAGKEGLARRCAVGARPTLDGKMAVFG